MDTDTIAQIMELPGGSVVTLNIGLGKGAGHSLNTVQHRLRAVSKTLPQVMQPGYRADLHLTPHRVWHNEPMVVVHGVFKEIVARHELLWDMVVQLDQDCIAIYEHCTQSAGKGSLFGPRRSDWGGFNINLFYFIGDKHD